VCVCVPACLSVCVCVSLPVCLSVCLSVCLTVCLLSVCLCREWLTTGWYGSDTNGIQGTYIRWKFVQAWMLQKSTHDNPQLRECSKRGGRGPESYYPVGDAGFQHHKGIFIDVCTQLQTAYNTDHEVMGLSCANSDGHFLRCDTDGARFAAAAFGENGWWSQFQALNDQLFPNQRFPNQT
jgi:hypothetical protein